MIADGRARLSRPGPGGRESPETLLLMDVTKSVFRSRQSRPDIASDLLTAVTSMGPRNWRRERGSTRPVRVAGPGPTR
jgi:hypothetical protein